MVLKLVKSWLAAASLIPALALSGQVRAQDTAPQDAAAALPQSGAAQPATDLPEPRTDPLSADFSADPILNLADRAADPAAFRRIIAAALRGNAANREAAATIEVAEAQVDEAQAGLLPTLDINASTYRVIDRRFSNDPTNIIERSRPDRRTDVLASLEQVLFDFGATTASIRAARARLRSAEFDQEATAGDIVSQMIAAWYAVFAYQALVELAEDFVASQSDLRESIEERIAEGVSAQSDLAQVDSLEAEGRVRLAQFRRRLASAEARFTALSGVEPPPRLLRAPLLVEGMVSKEFALAAAENAPVVDSAEALARAAQAEARATIGEETPRVSLRVDAGRYGVLEDRDDYDVRGSLNLRYRLGGAGFARIDAAKARAEVADARADRIRQEAVRDAAIIWADVRALEAQLRALEAAYIAARQSRDVVFTRFAALRGSLFDVADAQSAYFAAAIAYIEALTELDSARYQLLERTGRILPLFEDEAVLQDPLP